MQRRNLECYISPCSSLEPPLSAITEIRWKNLTHRVPPFKVIKVTGTDTDRSATYDFLLTIHSNHGPIPYRFRDKRRFRSKIANFPTHPHTYLTPPLRKINFEFCNGGSAQKTRVMPLQDGEKTLTTLSFA